MVIQIHAYHCYHFIRFFLGKEVKLFLSPYKTLMRSTQINSLFTVSSIFLYNRVISSDVCLYRTDSGTLNLRLTVFGCRPFLVAGGAPRPYITVCPSTWVQVARTCCPTNAGGQAPRVPPIEAGRSRAGGQSQASHLFRGQRRSSERGGPRSLYCPAEGYGARALPAPTHDTIRLARLSRCCVCKYIRGF